MALFQAGCARGFGWGSHTYSDTLLPDLSIVKTKLSCLDILSIHLDACLFASLPEASCTTVQLSLVSSGLGAGGKSSVRRPVDEDNSLIFPMFSQHHCTYLFRRAR